MGYSEKKIRLLVIQSPPLLFHMIWVLKICQQSTIPLKPINLTERASLVLYRLGNSVPVPNNHRQPERLLWWRQKKQYRSIDAIGKMINQQIYWWMQEIWERDSIWQELVNTPTICRKALKNKGHCKNCVTCSMDLKVMDLLMTRVVTGFKYMDGIPSLPTWSIHHLSTVSGDG